MRNSNERLQAIFERVLKNLPPESAGNGDDSETAGLRGNPTTRIEETLGIPRAYWQGVSVDFDELALDLARPRSLFIYGGNGTGKSCAAAAAAVAWGASWVSVLKLLPRIRRSFKSSVAESELDIIEDLIGRRVVVLDDLFACAKSDFGLSSILAILNGRLEDLRITIVTSDRDLEAIDRLDSSLASRLSGFHRVRIVGEDRRIRG